MALIPCTECGNEISAAAAACPKCGHPVKWQPSHNPATEGLSAWKKTAIVLITIVIAFFALGFYKANTPEGKEKSRARAAIELCRETPGGISTGACAGMEREFIEKYGVTP